MLKLFLERAFYVVFFVAVIALLYWQIVGPQPS
jgi:hypothetical protein